MKCRQRGYSCGRLVKTCFQGIGIDGAELLPAASLSFFLLLLHLFFRQDFIFFPSKTHTRARTQTHTHTNTSTATSAAFRQSVLLSHLRCSVPRLVPAPSKKRDDRGGGKTWTSASLENIQQHPTLKEKINQKQKESSLEEVRKGC